MMISTLACLTALNFRFRMDIGSYAILQRKAQKTRRGKRSERRNEGFLIERRGWARKNGKGIEGLSTMRKRLGKAMARRGKKGMEKRE